MYLIDKNFPTYVFGFEFQCEEINQLVEWSSKRCLPTLSVNFSTAYPRGFSLFGENKDIDISDLWTLYDQMSIKLANEILRHARPSAPKDISIFQFTVQCWNMKEDTPAQLLRNEKQNKNAHVVVRSTSMFNKSKLDQSERE